MDRQLFVDVPHVKRDGVDAASDSLGGGFVIVPLDQPVHALKA